MYIHGMTLVSPLTLTLLECCLLPYLKHISPIIKICGLLQLIICGTFYLIVQSPLAVLLQLKKFTD